MGWVLIITLPVYRFHFIFSFKISNIVLWQATFLSLSSVSLVINSFVFGSLTTRCRMASASFIPGKIRENVGFGKGWNRIWLLFCSNGKSDREWFCHGVELNDWLHPGIIKWMFSGIFCLWLFLAGLKAS